MTIPQTLELAMQHHQAGRLAEAEALYRQILATQPEHAEALHLLGVIAVQVGRHDAAVEWIRKAVALDPKNPEAHSNLGVACRALGRLDEAIAAYRRALELQPDYPQAHNNLGAALAAQGRLDEAIAAFRRALERQPDHAEACKNLGNALRDRGQFDEAIAVYRRALELQPDAPETHNALGIALRERGQIEEASAAFRRAIELQPNDPEGHNNLGAALAGLGRLDEAIAACRRALELRPGYPQAHNNLGYIFRERGQPEEAVAACLRALQIKPNFPEALDNLGAALLGQGRAAEAIAAGRRALELQPDFPEAHNNLGAALARQGQLDEAITAYRRALELQPGCTPAHNNLGTALKSRGEVDAALASFRQALKLQPDDAPAHSNLIFCLHLHPGQNEKTIAAEHRRWNRRFSDPLKPFLQPHANDPAIARPLRIGYVSADFRDHPVGRHVLPLLERHDREQFEIFCYSGVVRPDPITERLRALNGRWRNTFGVSDARLAEMIREDGVDILVDLALHTAGNRLPVFARQPAPVQVAWLGYPGSTGLRGIGYRLTDGHMEPPEEKSAWTAEKPVRLPDCWSCYRPADETPEVNALPALSAEGVTFGSLNNFAKMHEGVLALWARVLEAVQGSRLLMYCPEGLARERVRAALGARGIAAERVELVGASPRPEYLRLHQRIDIGLDPFPFNGMSTTCDALWMGTPVLTLPGKMPASRAGLSILSSVGLGELAAASEEDFVRMAVELAGDLPRLAELRAGLRPRMQASPLMDTARFTQNVEAAYRTMWKTWARKRDPAPKRKKAPAPPDLRAGA